MASKTLASQARLLCVSATLLAPESAGPAKALQELTDLDAQSADLPAARVVDEARRLRSECLRELAQVRRAAKTSRSTSADVDALLAQLSKRAGLLAYRDDRGVVVMLVDALDAEGVRPEMRETVTELGAIAKARPDFPVLVVLHRAHGQKPVGPTDAMGRALMTAGAPSVKTEDLGDLQPTVDPHLPGARERNNRVEVVFVTPGIP